MGASDDLDDVAAVAGFTASLGNVERVDILPFHTLGAAIPVLVIQGDADRILPFDKTGKRLPGLIPDVNLVVVEGGPHAIPWTHTDEVNAALLRFLGHPAA